MEFKDHKHMQCDDWLPHEDRPVIITGKVDIGGWKGTWACSETTRAFHDPQTGQSEVYQWWTVVGDQIFAATWPAWVAAC